MSASASAASCLICALALISIRIPAGNGHGVVFGSGKNASDEATCGRDAEFLSRAMIVESVRSKMYSGVLPNCLESEAPCTSSDKGISDGVANESDNNAFGVSASVSAWATDVS